jgi:hypothetical protein
MQQGRPGKTSAMTMTGKVDDYIQSLTSHWVSLHLVFGVMIWLFMAWLALSIRVRPRNTEGMTAETRASWDQHYRSERGTERAMKIALLLGFGIWLWWNY